MRGAGREQRLALGLDNPPDADPELHSLAISEPANGISDCAVGSKLFHEVSMSMLVNMVG